MKSGRPWNLSGRRPQAPGAARDTAQKPDVSLGEWLNSVVQSSDEGGPAEEFGRRPQLPPEKPRYRRDRIHHDDARARYEGRPYRDERLAEREEHRRDAHERRHDRGDRWRDDHDQARRHPPQDDAREAARHEVRRVEERREGARREEERRQEARRKPVREERPPLTEVREEGLRAAAREDLPRENPRLEAVQEKWREATRESEPRQAAIDEAASQEATREQARREVAREEERREKAREDAAREERRLESLREEARREATRAREGLGDINERLDELTQQLDRLAHAQAARQQAVLARFNEPAEPPKPQMNKPQMSRPQLTGAPPQRRRVTPEELLSIDDAVAEITARQRVLDNETAAPPDLPRRGEGLLTAAAELAPAGNAASRPAHPAAALHSAALDAAIMPPGSPAAPAPAMDFSVLEARLRQITASIEALQPASDIEKAIAAIRTDIAEMGRQLGEALPRRAVESLEIEVKALGERIDHSRQCRADPNALAGLESGLAEVREALRTLTPAENLVGFDQTLKTLSQRLDTIPARNDPSSLQQLEAAIDGLRGLISHVASNDALAKVADDVRGLASQVDRLASSAAAGQPVSALGALAGPVEGTPDHAATATVVSALEQRIDTLTAALAAASGAGQAMPPDFEKLLAGLTEKLDRAQPTSTDQATLSHFDDRIAGLVQRFDASDARLGHLEAIERGLSDLLVHMDEIRALKGGAPAAVPDIPAVHAIERDVAEIKQSERRTQDTLEAVQGSVEHLVDRLATIESNLHRGAAPRVPLVAQLQPAPAPALAPAFHDAEAADNAEPAASAGSLSSPSAEGLAEPPPSGRLAIDPTLPPDHPLEPGFTSTRTRPSAAERIADSEAAIGSAKPPVISDAERPNFIAAARRAAQAAAWEPPRQRPKFAAGAEQSAAQSSKLSQNIRKLIVAGSIVLIVVGCIRIATRLFEGSNSGATPQSPPEQTAPPVEPPQKIIPPKQPSSATAPALPLPNPAPAVPPSVAPAKPATPGRQSMVHTGDQTTTATMTPPVSTAPHAAAMPSWAVPDITGALPSAIAGALPSPAATPSIVPTAAEAAAIVDDKLPVTIGNLALRKAAMAGDPAAAYEVASRFAEGRGVLQNDEEAAHWLQVAVQHDLAPAQFRLGGLYEKGLGVKKDLPAARDLYLAAAQQGNGNAMHNLAVLYAEGVNGSPDYNDAVVWFRKAADHGIRDSEYNLGILYARGIGVKTDNAESYKWFALAAKQGDKDAAGKRDEIASRLDAQSLAAARLAVQNWSPQAQPDDAINVKMPAAWNAPVKSAQATKPQ